MHTPERLDADHEPREQEADRQGVGPPAKSEESGHQPSQRQWGQQAGGSREPVKRRSPSEDHEPGVQQTDRRTHGEVAQEPLPLAHGRPVLGGEPWQRRAGDLSDGQAH